MPGSKRISEAGCNPSNPAPHSIAAHNGWMLIPAHNPSDWTGPDGQQHVAPQGAGSLRSSTPASGTTSTWTLSRRRWRARGSRRCSSRTGTPIISAGFGPFVRAGPDVRVLDAAALAGTSHVAAGDATLRVVPTPGHAPDHLCFFDEASGDLYCGDLVRLGGTIVIPASKGGNLAQYLASLRARPLPGAAPPATGTRADNRRSGAPHRRVHRAPRRERAAGSRGARVRLLDAGRDRGSHLRPLPASIVSAAVDTIRAHLAKLKTRPGT
jgi:hypothetical protein